MAELPLGDARLLDTKAKATRVAYGFNLMFSQAKGQQMVITLNAQYRHSLTHLLFEVFDKTDSDHDLSAVGDQDVVKRPERLI